MSSRGVKMKSLTDVMIGVQSGRERECDVPAEVLEFILSQLNLRDNIRASAVCRRWLTAAVSVRLSNRRSLLMCFPKHGDLHEFYDPSDRKTYHLDLPELRGSRILYAKGNWLLLGRPSTQELQDVFFFCPYTREMIMLPKLPIEYQKVAFSCAPTSSDCVVFAVISIFFIHTCHPGETEWNVLVYHNPQEESIRNPWHHQIVFSNAHIYLLNVFGQVGCFNLANNTWKAYTFPAPKCTLDLPFENRWSAKFMAEHDGKIYVICTCAAENPVIYRFDGTWTEVVSLGGMTLFANASSSLARTGLAGKLAGNVVFPKILLYGRRCVTYYPSSGRYYPRNQLYNWNEEEQMDNVWIDAPNDASIFL
ncbi:hypothetical protein CASFOL_032226 [Castilleja foliolosa]|uniref:F-box domain-containing protein n=1 Tax=Castilleja foliolosa TaxID=1961234 RepID=A0ABD3C3G7_9LAMI